ncbi:Glycerol kinase [Sinobacterium norvegicum]|uniref:Glycerol kinase n=1 Tax=Sinobacterium norvegicum TaxID=1641715 RepID=A0ABM9AK28_9GAMM|nr:glycerol kinase GlpK [Sinobacterium norvegicum]CAH0993414.1 Glycerol kinase [Sinobacterium norvegicum]
MLFLTIDQGTTSTRALVIDSNENTLGLGQQAIVQHYPNNGWVEHDPEQIWQSTLDSCQLAIASAVDDVSQLAALAITNQRETVVLWDRQTGKPVYNAIVWQDRRTDDYCDALKAQGHESYIQSTTGLLLDPYFSASKINWLLDNIEGARERAEAGELAVGTIDCFLVWRLTNGQSHITDATNASRTSLFDIHQQCWDEKLLDIFNIPEAILPTVVDNSGALAVCDQQHFGLPLAIKAMIGDQQSALIGQGCVETGLAKSTFGTGSFLMLNTGDVAAISEHRMLTTVAFRLSGQLSFAIEGSLFCAGSTMDWLRDKLQIIDHIGDIEPLVKKRSDSRGVYLVPAFTGLGAPYWQPKVNAALVGMTLDSDRADVVTAALQSVVYQTQELLMLMAEEGVAPQLLAVDGGMVANSWMCQFLSDMLAIPVVRPRQLEATALGAARLAMLACGVIEALPVGGRGEARSFDATMSDSQRQHNLQGWQRALIAARSMDPSHC